LRCVLPRRIAPLTAAINKTVAVDTLWDGGSLGIGQIPFLAKINAAVPERMRLIIHTIAAPAALAALTCVGVSYCLSCLPVETRRKDARGLWSTAVLPRPTDLA
jgi:hypothetical protein